MMSIRFRILLLSIVALTAVATAFYIESQDITGKLHLAENSLQTLSDVRSLSKLIHPIQKERGLTAGDLIGHDETLHNLLLKQREITDSQWSELGTVELLTDQKLAQNLPARLTAMRQRIDSGATHWDEAREFYTSTVQRLLELMVLKVAALDYAEDISYELQALSYIAISREKLGLIRATLNRGYQHGQLSKKELDYLSRYYGTFIDNFTIYEAISKMHFEKTADSAWLVEIRTEVFSSVIFQIDNTLKTEGKVFQGTPSTWWREATLVIDTMRKTETAILEDVKHQTLEQTTYYKNYLYKYAIFAFIVLTIVALLTGLTVYRILKALSILINSLENVEQTQNYGIRIRTQKKDEFGKLSYSINSLLGFTDKIIKDKEFLASTDLLTGVMNRRSFIIASEEEIKRSERYGTPLSMIYCDIDFFKLINDQHGHAVGDEVLKKFAKTLKENLRSSDYLGRWGGEEFIILTTEIDLVSAEKLSEKLRQKIMELSIQPVEQVTCSFGVAEKKGGELFEALCERADQALYQAKESGRNKVCLSAG
ncbi:MAG: diguanylate cyclase [Proteobacteria bacterium]|nr:diguanylate cyclase [Pseudomonadota bacterium]